MASTPSGPGYWLVAADGGVFSYGGARFYGSSTHLLICTPIAGIAATADGGGYWLVGEAGGVFAFGDARYIGLAGRVALVNPVEGGRQLNRAGHWWPRKWSKRDN